MLWGWGGGSGRWVVDVEGGVCEWLAGPHHGLKRSADNDFRIQHFGERLGFVEAGK